MTALPAGQKVLLQETFPQQCRWMESPDGPELVDIMSKFPAFMKFPEKLNILLPAPCCLIYIMNGICVMNSPKYDKVLLHHRSLLILKWGVLPKNIF